MLARVTYGTALTVLICLADVGVANAAAAVPAEIARKCTAMANRAYPLRASHNPASGREHGSSHAVRAYFNRCVANGGKMKKNMARRDTTKKHDAIKFVSAGSC